MAVADYFDTVQKVYIAFYQRPADPAGLYYWSQRVDAENGNLSAVIDAFANSAEATRLFFPTAAEGETLYDLLTEENIGGVIDAIYLALFNRAPDEAGKQFYVDGFADGTFTAGNIMLNILNGAQGDDAVAVANKLEVASLFTTALDPEQDGIGPFQATYNAADEQVARDWLATVTSDTATRKTESEVVTDIQTAIADSGDAILGQTAGQTFTLTQGVDAGAAFAGTNGNDLFVAADHNMSALIGNNIFGVGDDIKGGAGTDTLQILGQLSLGSANIAKIAEIEKIELTSDNNAAATDLRNVVGLQEVTVKGGLGVAANLAGRDIVAGIDGAMIAGTGAAVFTYAAADTPNDSATLKLNNAVVTPGTAIAVTIQNTAGAAIENLTINNTGTSRINLNGGLQDNITVNATGSLRIDGVANVLDTFTATGSTGNVRANLTARLGELDVALGSGNDRVDASNAAFINTALSTFKGDTGTDTFVLNAAFDNTGAAGVGTQRTALNQLDGFEVFGVSGIGNTADINLANTTISQFLFENTGNTTLTQIENGDSFTVNNDTNVAATMKTGQTTLNLNLLSQATGTDVGALTTTGVQTVNLASNAAAANQPANTIGFVNNGVANNFTVNVTGAQDLTIGGFGAVVNVNAAAATGDLNITGSNGADIIIGGSGDDIIRGGQGADVLTGNGGQDDFHVSFGSGAVAPGNSTLVFAVPDAAATAAANNLNVITVSVTGLGIFTYDASADANGGATATALQNIIQAADGGAASTITVGFVDGTDSLTVTDTAGRVMSGTASTDAVAAVASTADVLTAGFDFGDLNSITLTIGGVAGAAQALAVTDLDADTNVDADDLAAAINALAIPSVTAANAAGTVTITDALGRGISASINERTDVSFSVAAADLDATGNQISLTIDGVNGNAPIAVTFDTPASGAALASAMQAALRTATGIADLTVTGSDVADVDSTTAGSQAGFGVEIAIPSGADVLSLNVVDSASAGLALWGLVGSAAAITPAAAIDNGTVKAVAANAAGSQAAAAGNLAAPVFTPNGGVIGINPTSDINAMDTISDFKLGEDLLVLTQSNGVTGVTPTAAFYAGDVTSTATSLANALALALTDANGSASGIPALADGNAVFFQYQGNTYAYVDDQADAVAFNAADLDNVMVKITGSLGLTEGAVTVATIFA